MDLGTDSFDDLLLQQNRIRVGGQAELPLGASQIIPQCRSADASSIGRYFVLVERLCDSFVDTAAHASQDKFNINVPVSMAFRRPGTISPRVPVDWAPTSVVTAKGFYRNYLRILAHYFDWVSHIPELEILSENDKELIITARAIPCSWLLMGHRSALHQVEGYACAIGEYFPTGKQQDYVDAEIRPLSCVCNAAHTDLIKPFQKIGVSESEYAMLRVICFFMPAPGMSSSGVDVVNEAKEKYLNAFTELVRLLRPEATFSEVLHRISRLLVLLPVAERISQLDDDTISMMSLFDYAGLRGTLTWDLHMKKNGNGI
ncbi:Nuclear hormone receptor [Aphelenchoides avenae]|nr:Nuclear hormone receptor [Aphelenchus avenae]